MTTTVAPASAQAFELPAGWALRVTDPEGCQVDGRLLIHRSPSRPGDHVVLRAETDLVVALAACADDVTECNGGRCGPLLVDFVPKKGQL